MRRRTARNSPCCCCFLKRTFRKGRSKCCRSTTKSARNVVSSCGSSRSRATCSDHSRALRLKFPQARQGRRLEFGGQRDGHVLGDVVFSGPCRRQRKLDPMPLRESFPGELIHHCAPYLIHRREPVSELLGQGHDALDPLLLRLFTIWEKQQHRLQLASLDAPVSAPRKELAKGGR